MNNPSEGNFRVVPVTASTLKKPMEVNGQGPLQFDFQRPDVLWRVSATMSPIDNWRSLLKDVHQCTLCAEHLPLGPRPVLQFNPAARILVAAQAPGKRVHETGLPFNDPSGDRLRDWMGIDRDTFYDPRQLAIIPMGFCYPGTGRSGDMPPRPECAQTWHHHLLARLPNLELTLVIGQYAHAYHLEKSRETLTQRVANWRGYWPQKLPMPHPSPRNNLWLRRNPWFEAEVIPMLRSRVSDILGADDDR